MAGVCWHLLEPVAVSPAGYDLVDPVLQWVWAENFKSGSSVSGQHIIGQSEYRAPLNSPNLHTR